MDIIIPIFLVIFATMFFLTALFEERDTNTSDEDEEDKSTNLIILLLSLSTALFFIGGVCMMYITQTYYDIENNTISEIYLDTYRPLAYVFFGLGIISIILVAQKSMDYLGKQWDRG